jgi:hypothetical protein
METVINGQRVVRIRKVADRAFLPGFTVVMWHVTDPGTRKQIGPNHLTFDEAASWVSGKGWRIVGSAT